ncbi:hypothetical protein JW921_00245 [Candidatus Fermentibacterales bacterium]|nr:hypothetical protein [Candidatus Fermentibacterales bacterium]
MIHKLCFGIGDVPACARYGLSARKIWVLFKALVLSWLAWGVFVYLGFLAAGEDIASVWSRARLLPLPGGIFWESWPAVALLAVGCALIVYALEAAFLKVARMTFEQARGDDFFSGRDASAFLSAHYKPLIATPVALLIAVLLTMAGGWLLGLLGSIPAVGPVIMGLVAVPAFGAGLILILLLLAFSLGFFLVPPIVATTRGDTFESLFELFSTITSQPWRLALYSLVRVLVVGLATAVFLLFSSLSLGLLSWVVSLAAGPGLGQSLVSAPQYVGPELFGSFSGLVDPLGMVPVQASPWGGLAGVLTALSGWAILLLIVSYPLSACFSGWTITYLALRYRKDGEDLLARADDEEYRAFEQEYGSADESEGGSRPLAGSAPGQVEEEERDDDVE